MKMLGTKSLLLLVALQLAGCGEVRETHYESYAAAVRDGAVERGWIPTFVPPTAFDIYEVHNQDTNAQRLRFRVPVADAPSLTRNLRPVTVTELREYQQLGLPSLSVAWPREIEPGSIEITNMGLFVTSDSTVVLRCVAVDWRTGMVYVWSCTAPASARAG